VKELLERMLVVDHRVIFLIVRLGPHVKVFNFRTIHFVCADVAVKELCYVQTFVDGLKQERIDYVELTDVVLVLKHCVDKQVE